MCTAQGSSLGGNKLVPSRTLCPRAVAEDWLKRNSERGRCVDVTRFLWDFFGGERRHSDFSFRGDDLDFGEAAGQPSGVYGSYCIAGGRVGAATCRE
jgi:hypothetical protein